MKLDEAFPDDDSKLAAHIADVDEMMRPYANALSAHDFVRAKQEGCLKAAQAFVAELAAKPAKSGARKASTVEREAIFERLRHPTGYFGRLGRAALRTDKARAEFDRVQPSAPAKKKAKAPAVAAKTALAPDEGDSAVHPIANDSGRSGSPWDGRCPLDGRRAGRRCGRVVPTLPPWIRSAPRCLASSPGLRSSAP